MILMISAKLSWEKMKKHRAQQTNKVKRNTNLAYPFTTNDAIMKSFVTFPNIKIHYYRDCYKITT
jgi:hypothetical protein